MPLADHDVLQVWMKCGHSDWKPWSDLPQVDLRVVRRVQDDCHAFLEHRARPKDELLRWLIGRPKRVVCLGSILEDRVAEVASFWPRHAVPLSEDASLVDIRRQLNNSGRPERRQRLGDVGAFKQARYVIYVSSVLGESVEIAAVELVTGGGEQGDLFDECSFRRQDVCHDCVQSGPVVTAAAGDDDANRVEATRDDDEDHPTTSKPQVVRNVATGSTYRVCAARAAYPPGTDIRPVPYAVRDRAKIPDSIRHRTKWALALEIIDELATWGLTPPVIAADAGYGEITAFRLGLQARGIPSVLAVKAPTSAYPATVVPKNPSKHPVPGAHSRPAIATSRHR
jgi:hypothetical protein